MFRTFLFLMASTFCGGPCLAQFPLPGQGGYDFSADDVTAEVGESFTLPILIDTENPVSWLGLYVTNDAAKCQPNQFQPGAGVIAYEFQHGTIPCDVGMFPDHVFISMAFTPIPYDSDEYGNEFVVLEYEVAATEPGTTTIDVLNAYTMVSEAEVTVTIVAAESEFLRGDVDGDGACALPDVFKLLQLVFVADETSECWDSADINDDGALDIADGVALLANLYLAGPWEIPPPSEACGVDPTADDFAPCGSACP